MATVVFYEKPNCINNTRQKKLLREAGHTLIERNLLTETWDAMSLRRFFGSLPVSAWFNRSAPAVKAGEVVPESLSESEALRLMLADPILIRRPLMQVGDRCVVGFDPTEVAAWIGLAASAKTSDDLENCPKEHGNLAHEQRVESCP